MSTGAKDCTWFGSGIDDTEPVSLSRVTYINRGDHRVVDTRSGWLPIPAAVAASEETVTRSSAVHLSRIAQVDRDTFGRSSAKCSSIVQVEVRRAIKSPLRDRITPVTLTFSLMGI